MRATLTISLPEDLRVALEKSAKLTGRSRSQIVQESLRRQMASERFQALRRKLVPRARAAGLYTDEDVFRAVS
jgi:predicted transcriptional regulator